MVKSAYRPSGAVHLVMQLTRIDAKTTVLWGGLKISLALLIFLFILGEWCVVHL